jgi:hypothetical protein
MDREVIFLYHGLSQSFPFDVKPFCREIPEDLQKFNSNMRSCFPLRRAPPIAQYT